MSTLSDYIIFKNGKTRPKTFGHFPVYGGNGIIDYTDLYNMENGIVIGRVGAYCGSVFMTKKKCWVSDNAIQAFNKDSSDLDFDFYLLKSLHLNERHIGTSQPLLTQEILNNINVNLPSLEEQKRIASILLSLDKKIENNNAINNNLQQQAQATFAEWILKCEEQKRIGDLATNILDYTENPNNEVVLVNSSDVTYGHFEHHILSQNKELKGHFKKRFQQWDILYSEIRPRNKHYAYCQFNPDKYIASTRLMVIRNRPEMVASSILYQYLQLNSVFEEFTLKTESRSGTFPQGNYEDLSTISIPYSGIEKQAELKKIFDSFYAQIWHNEQENNRLTELRDTLLPRLMSGEIDVSDIQI